MLVHICGWELDLLFWRATGMGWTVAFWEHQQHFWRKTARKTGSFAGQLQWYDWETKSIKIMQQLAWLKLEWMWRISLHQSDWPDFCPSTITLDPPRVSNLSYRRFVFKVPAGTTPVVTSAPPSEDVDEVWLFPAGKKEGGWSRQSKQDGGKIFGDLESWVVGDWKKTEMFFL